MSKPGVDLGSTLDFSCWKGVLFHCILDRLLRLASWKLSFLSFLGRFDFSQSLSAIPTYLFSVFRVPKYFVREVRSTFIRFLWGKGEGNGVCWKKWKDLCKQRD